MDLTKVTLPTFILERRSLLEMYAEFFSHPEFFAITADQPDDRRRFMTIVKWYLSCFHTLSCIGHSQGSDPKKGSSARKPYNPVLGETFQCHWDLHRSLTGNRRSSTCESSTSEADVANEEVSRTGPVPRAGPRGVSFIAEQVSHHPPISAFYAEQISKRVEVNGHIHTKSKFMGLSIGVHMVGEAKVKLLNKKEVYSVTFPSAYARSIMTVPWAELGGKTTIQCQPTGYRANVTFHTKSMVNTSKLHAVTCECFDASNRKFCTIKGQWNGKMTLIETGQKVGVDFMDTSKMQANPKIVRPIEEQSETESRKLWQHVSKALRMKDHDTATSEKRIIEDQQRTEARARAQSKQEWTTRHFEHDGRGHYVYRTPLGSRLRVATASADLQPSEM